MTASEQLQLEVREEVTFDIVKKLIQNGASMELISKSFGLSFRKIKEIIKNTEKPQG